MEQEQHHETHHRGLQPRIYVASLSDYTDGVLHGVWIDATDDPDDIRAAIAAMLAASRDPTAEEFAIHDYSDFGGFSVGEYEDIDTAHKVASGLAQHGDAFGSYVDLVGTEEASDSGFLDSYRGTFPTFQDFADQFRDDMGWNDELDRLRERSGIGQFLRFDDDLFEDTIRSEWSICDRSGRIDIFTF